MPIYSTKLQYFEKQEWASQKIRCGVAAGCVHPPLRKMNKRDDGGEIKTKSDKKIQGFTS